MAEPAPADTTGGNNADIVGKYADRLALQVWQKAGFFDRPQTIQEQLEQQRRGGRCLTESPILSLLTVTR